MKKCEKSGTRGRTGDAGPMKKSAFAKLCGVHRSSITRAIQSGVIITDAAGLVDPSLKVNRDYRHDVAVKAAERRALRYAEPSGGKTKKQLAYDFKNMPPIDVEAALEKMPAPKNITQAKKFIEIQKIFLETRDRLGELISRPLVEDRLADMSKNIDMFSAIADAVAGRICERLDRQGRVEDVKRIIAPEVAKIIESFKNIAAKKI